MMGATGRSRLSDGMRSQHVAVSAAIPEFTAAPSNPILTSLRQHDYVDMAM
jgi:hypothetical protein